MNSLDVDLLDDISLNIPVFSSQDIWEDPDESDVQDFLECHLEDQV